MVDKYTVTTGTNLAYDDDATWTPISIRSDAFQWTASGSGTGEYYLAASGGGNPNTVLSGFAEPQNVQANGTALTAGTAGTLAVSEWDWADNDTLGFSTVYVRLSDGADPDTKAEGFVTFTDTPNANDNVYFRGSVGIKGGNFSAVELDDIIVLPGFSGSIGDAIKPLKLDMADTDRIEITSTGTIYLSLGTAACSPKVYRTASASQGQAGLYLVDCTALNDLFIEGGTVKCLGTTVDDVYIRSAGTLLGDADSTITNDLHNTEGTFEWGGAGVNAYNNNGTGEIEGTDAWTTVRSVAGAVEYNSSGILTNAEALGTGVIDLTNNNESQTITNVKVEGDGQVIYDNATTTLTNVQTGDGIIQVRGGAN